MDHSANRIRRQNENDFIGDRFRAEQITDAERGVLAAALRELPPETLFRSISEVSARRVHGPVTLAGRVERPVLSVPIDELVRFSLFEEFLAPEELARLTEYTLSQEQHFRTSQVIAHDSNEGNTDYNHRRSRVLFGIGPFQELMADRLRSYLVQLMKSLRHPMFAVSSVEAQITASSDGEYFRTHNDNTHAALVTRELTYVLFFHQEPKAFTGGELRLYDSRFESGRYVAGRAFISITPQQNTLVFFPSHFMHEVMTVHCPSRAFADSRFTLNGWLHR